jgi:hypothetical protein
MYHLTATEKAVMDLAAPNWTCRASQSQSQHIVAEACTVMFSCLLLHCRAQFDTGNNGSGYKETFSQVCCDDETYKYVTAKPIPQNLLRLAAGITF